MIKVNLDEGCFYYDIYNLSVMTHPLKRGLACKEENIYSAHMVLCIRDDTERQNPRAAPPN